MEERGRRRHRGGGPGPRSRWPSAGEYRHNDPPTTNEGPNRRGRGSARRRRESHSRQSGDRDDSPQRNEENKLNSRRNTGENTRRSMGFLALQDIAIAEPDDILIKINNQKGSFMRRIETPADSDKLDTYVLILRMLSKCTLSAFDQLKLNLVLEVCNSRFIGNLRNYMMDLPYAERKIRNKLYWDSQQQFWEDFIVLCEYIVDASPTTAIQKCRSLIENTSKTCLEGLLERHSFTLLREQQMKLEELRERLVIEEKETVSQTKVKKQSIVTETTEEEIEPPDDFRNLSVLPTHEDLLKQPFLRPNIVAGAYRDIDHYLDVQFRLLREDCFGPLREGILQFIADPKRKKFDNVRIFRNVQFVGFYASDNKVGSVIQFDEKTQRRFSKINWAYSKRFIFGSLLLFTKDNCKSFITATILERDDKLLSKGRIPVSIVNANINITELFNKDVYVMIESEVYFEPYYHVLKALKDPKFPRHLAFSKYIVDVNAQANNPSYLTPDTEYKVIRNDLEIKFNVMEEATWPTKEDLGLNESQYEAYKLALTREFVVIQGPPGTGKTFIGIKIAETLLNNGKYPMLVVCYTNHALDQFLEGIMSVTTQKVVRIGGQSRNEAMNGINLSNLRRLSHLNKELHFVRVRSRFKDILRELQNLYKGIDSLNDGIISYDCLKKYSIDAVALGNFYKTKRGEVTTDPLILWLFEGMEFVDVDYTNNEFPEHITDKDNQSKNRNDIILDDFEEDVYIDTEKTKLSFSFNKTEAFDTMKVLNRLRDVETDFYRKQQIEYEIKILNSRIICFNRWSTVIQTDHYDGRQTYLKQDMSKISMYNRWVLYFRWAKKVFEILQNRIISLQEEFEPASEAYEESRMIVDLQLLRNMNVIGMTTSGAARLRKMLKGIAPRIVIVEEAAEVLEQHIITALTKDCKHLILIGDHQQLRPSAAHAKLAREYNLEVSLFERMIKNGIHSRRLRVQHRMRPEIAALIAPHIYPDLQNHHTVENFPCVRGMTKNLFFFSHNFEEKENEDGSSKSNPAEAEVALGLCNYLIQQRYEPEDVTVLTAYTDQLFYMKKQRKKYANLSKVKITVVDNYQGEESKIIILSLVRNNTRGNIGFLGTENRICVALSRAKEGFYILGNMDLLKKKSHLWENIASTLESQSYIGSSFILRCENHPDQITTINSVTDFEKVPEGGCLQKCEYNLRCGHRCPRVCHSYDTGHDETKCYVKCDRILCDLGHGCDKKCYEDCGQCIQLIEKTLPCGHKAQIFCHLEPTDKKVKCRTTVNVTLPNCGHNAIKMCYEKIDTVKCIVPCEYRVEPCGHKCEHNCHVTNDPNHEKYCCNKPCAKAKRGCMMNLIEEYGDHQCLKKCYEECDPCNVEILKKRSHCRHLEKVPCCEDVNEKPCLKNCSKIMECGHHCKKQCYEQCGDCKQMVKKPVPGCNHFIKVECMVTVTREMCKDECGRTLECGHPCAGRCGDQCSSDYCTYLIPDKIKSPCGHLVMLPCNLYKKVHTGADVKAKSLMAQCREPCTVELACEHVCGGSCSACRQGRIHLPCAQTCHRLNICGHRCQEPCNKMCPPCKMPCEIRCEHSRCRKLCGEPCIPCNEKCTRACPHGRCGRRCGQKCGRAPCAEPCGLALRCGHRCRGLCGEPCPEICKICRPDEFPVDFLGDEYQDDDKFIKLEDCPHVLDIDNMDSLMMGDTQTVEIKTCPFCRKPIINTQRYKDYVNNLIKTEINPIKEKVYGDKETIKSRKEELLHRIVETFEKFNETLSENPHLKLAFKRLARESKILKSPSLLHLDMLLQYLNILVMILEKYEKYLQSDLNLTRYDDVNEVIELLCVSLASNSKKLSIQLQKDIGNEIKRLTSLIQFATILSQSSCTSPKIKDSIEAAEQVVLVQGIFDENAAADALKQLEETVKLSGIVTKEERDLIVKAISSKAGSWYKCPNGHFYCISLCGGAMEISKCADCGAAIGGQRHALLSDNRHASEIDGSSHAAWPIHDDMRNFGF